MQTANQELRKEITVPWCRFFIPKMVSSSVRPDDPDFNEHLMYAKCIKGHVLKDANDWILCENLPAPDSKCWQEGGETLFSLMAKKSSGSQADEDQQALQDEITVQSSTS